MRSRNESSRCDSRSYSGPARPRTRHDSLQHAGEQGVDLIDLPCRTRVSFSQNCSEDRRAPEELTSYKRSTFAIFWEQHIALVVDRGACRDHLALERTFLAYMRTSSMLALTGVLVAQLTLLQQQDSGFGYSRVGKPLAVCCYASAIWTVLSGACRVWRYQQALIRGQALTGGFELASITMVFLALLAVFFGFTVAIDTPGHPSRTT